MGTKVTVIVPVYNTERYLEQCVCSVTGQTYPNLEILLIDDGSKDHSGSMCDGFAREDGRIRVVHKINGGLSSVRNHGIKEAKGDYIMFVDSDDWLDTDAVEMLVSCAENTQADVVKYNYVREYMDKQLVKRNTFLEERAYTGAECRKVCRQVLGLTGDEMSHPESMNFLASCCFYMYKRQLLLDSNVKFVDTRQIGSFEDGLFNFSVFQHIKCFAYIDRAFYHYRKTNVTSLTSVYRENYICKSVKLAEYLKNEVYASHSGDYFREAYNNRMVYTAMEIAFNAMANRAPFYVKYREINEALHHPSFVEAFKEFSLRPLGLKWKVYYFFIKYSLTFPMYCMTALILKLKRKGIA